MSAADNAAKSAASLASGAAPKDSPPLIAPTGNAPLDVLAGDINQVASQYDVLTSNDASSLDKAKAGIDLVLGAVQTPVNLLNDGFALATAGIAKIFPALPAATLAMLHLGWPHIHMHPPTYIPPAIFIPLPSLGGVALSGCASVLINGVPAARAGDLGIALICCSFAPPFEVFTGSSKVFIGGARAARMGDITKHCQPNMDGVGKAISGIQKVVAIGGKVMGVAGIASEAMGAVAKATDKKKPAKDPEPSGPDPVQALGNALVAVNAAAAAAKAEAAAKTAAAAVSAAGNASARADAEDDAEDAEDAAAEAEAVAAATAALLEADPQEEPEEPEAETDTTAAAVRMGVQAGLDAAAMAAGFLMGMDPGAPPCFGALLSGMPNVLIGGFPMPPWGAVAGGLGKLGKLKSKPLRKKSNGHDKEPPRHGENFKCDGVGEPVNPVTGANVDDWIDYEASGAIPFRWGRSYSSLHADQDGPMGRGFRHTYQRTLTVDLDFAVYTDAEGRPTEIPLPRSDEGETVCRGYTLRIRDRGPDWVYFIERTRAPAMEFVRERRAGTRPRLTRLLAKDAHAIFLYDEGGQLSGMVETSASGEVETRLVLDRGGHVLEVRRGPRGARDLPLVAAYGYDGRGCLVVAQNALGAKSSYAYDARGRMVRKTDPNGYSFHYAYDELGHCVEEHGGDGRFRVALQYDRAKRRTVVTQVDGGEWSIEYDANGTITRVLDPYGGERRRVLDAEGRPVREVGPGAHELRFLYDETGKHHAMLDGFGYRHATLDEQPNPADPLALRVPQTPWEEQWGKALGPVSAPPEVLPAPVQKRDLRGQVIEEVDASGRRQAWAYDACGNVVGYVDRDGREHRTLFSSWNQISAELDPLGHHVGYDYTMRSEIARVVDPGDSESRYEYDLKDRLTRVVRHGVVREEYVYDASDRWIEKRDRSGNVLLRRTIGANGLPVVRELTSGKVYRYEYDERGRTTRASTLEEEVRREFDWRGALICDERDGRGVRHRFHDSGDLRETTYLGRFVVAYDRMPDGSLSIRALVGGAQQLRRGEDGSVEIELGNGTRAKHSYNEGGQCLERELRRARDGKVALWRVRYLYSPEGDLLRVEDSVRGVTEYLYDAAHRLIGEKRPGGEVSPIVLDAAGNVLEKAGIARAELFEGNRLRASGRQQFRYDLRDHIEEQRTEDGATVRYRYDSSDMLVEVAWSGRDDVWTAGYDGLRRRTYKALGRARTEQYWDEHRLAAEVGPTGVLRLYVYAGPEALVPLMFIDYDGVDADPASGRAYYLIGNQIGVPLHIEDQEGRVVWWAEHMDPYGTISVRPDASIVCSLRFPGHHWDEETGLHYNRFRYYSPLLARYLQSDPVGQWGGSHLYAYPADPLTNTDALGLMMTRNQRQPPPPNPPPLAVTTGEVDDVTPLVWANLYVSMYAQGQSRIDPDVRAQIVNSIENTRRVNRNDDEQDALGRFFWYVHDTINWDNRHQSQHVVVGESRISYTPVPNIPNDPRQGNNRPNYHGDQGFNPQRGQTNAPALPEGSNMRWEGAHTNPARFTGDPASFTVWSPFTANHAVDGFHEARVANGDVGSYILRFDTPTETHIMSMVLGEENGVRVWSSMSSSYVRERVGNVDPPPPNPDQGTAGGSRRSTRLHR